MIIDEMTVLDFMIYLFGFVGMSGVVMASTLVLLVIIYKMGKDDKKDNDD